MSDLQVYVNGKWVPKQEAKISIWDHGFLYGDGIFEGIRVYNGYVFKLKEHLNRLYASAAAIDLTIPHSPDEMSDLIIETVRKNGLKESYIRLVVSRGAGDLGIDPRKCKEPTVMILADKINLYPEELYKTGIRVMIASTRRNPPDSLNGRIKSLNYLNNILAKLEHIKAGLDEAIMLNHEGYVVEGTAENVFVVKDRKLLTPPCYLGALEGITRGVVMDLAPEIGFHAEEAYQKGFEAIQPGAEEVRVAHAILSFLSEKGLTVAFDTIVASGERSAMPHGRPTSRKIQRGDIIVIDMGAVWEGYYSDITRTVCLGKPSDEARNIFALLQKAQEAAYKAIRPGAIAKDVDWAARKVIQDAGFGDHFSHGLGHGIGLEVHEAPSLRKTGDQVLEAGMVVTVEPGVYTPGKFGMRLEDDVLVTESGCQVLTALPHILEI